MNLLFDLLDVSLGFLAGLLFEVFDLLVKVRLDFALLAGKLDLVLIPRLSDLVSQFLAGELPLVDFRLINLLLPLEFLHAENILFEFANRDFTFGQLIRTLCLHLVQGRVHFTSLFVGTFLLLLFKLENLVSQLELFAHLGSIFDSKFFNYVLFLLDLGFELLHQAVIFSAPIMIGYNNRGKTYFLVMATSLSLIEFFSDGRSLVKRLVNE